MSETHYTKWVDAPYLRLRFHLITERGEVQSFLIQLEYNRRMASPAAEEWKPIARFDHNPDASGGHDVASEGLHLDLLDGDGSKHEVRRGFPSLPLDDTPEYCERYLLRYAAYFAEQFERRNGLCGKYSTP